jgi:3-methyladenine DNA glycosylase AlkD
MESTRLVRELQTRLQGKAVVETKDWWEQYLKYAIRFRGVKMADVRAVLHSWHVDQGIGGTLSLTEQKDLALALFREEHAEDKLAGILFLQEILLPTGGIVWQDDLSRFASLFAEGWIHDWNICDWFCVKVLGPLAQLEGEACARAIADWKTAENLWQRRAAGVAFVNLAQRGDENFAGFTDLLLDISAATVKHPERFSQTGTGWVLRELSLAEPARVERFVARYLCDFSNEGLRYATAKLAAESKRRLQKQRQQCS